MTLDYNDSRVKTKTRVGDKDEINSDYNNYNGNNNDNNNNNDSIKIDANNDDSNSINIVKDLEMRMIKIMRMIIIKSNNVVDSSSKLINRSL